MHILGDEVKALPNGRIGGYLVRFSTASDPDLVGDFFTKDTDFGSLGTTNVLYHHGKDSTLKARSIGTGTIQKDSVGVWIEAQLSLADDYEKAILEMVKAGKLRWSSGTAPHLVERQANGAANWVKAWPLGLDASVTPTPAEPRATAVALKTIEEHIIMDETTKATYNVTGTLDMSPVMEPSEDDKEPTDEQPAEAGATKYLHPHGLVGQVKDLTDEVKALRAMVQAPARKSTPVLIPGEPRTTVQDDYMKAFDTYIRKGGGIPNAIKALSTASGSGGALVPQSYSNEYSRKLGLGSVLRKAGVKVLKEPTGQPYNHTVTASSSVSATPGDGIISENVEFTSREPILTNVTFTPYIYTARAQVSMMLMDDSRFDVMGIISDNNTTVFAGHENRDFFVGTGTGMPQGITVGGTIVDSTSGTFQAADVKKLYYTMPEQYRIQGRCAWFANDLILKEMDSWNATTGPGIWNPSLADGTPGTLIGYPVFGSPYMSSTMNATDKILAFVNLDAYMIVDFLSVSLRRLDERYADQGAYGFIAYRRIDGRVLLSEAVVVLKMVA